jgi:hypothetical protein
MSSASSVRNSPQDISLRASDKECVGSSSTDYAALYSNLQEIISSVCVVSVRHEGIIVRGKLSWTSKEIKVEYCKLFS